MENEVRQEMQIPTINSEFKWARGLTRDLLQACAQSDLESQIFPGISPLWKQFRHIGRVHENYLQAISTRRLEFGFTDCTYSGGASKEALLAYYERLTHRHNSYLEQAQFDLTIDWFGEATNIPIHISRLLSHETLHHGQLILCWRALNKPFPKSWSGWGE